MVLKKYIPYLLFLISAFLGIYLLVRLNSDHQKKLSESLHTKHLNAHREALTKLEATIGVYQTIVSAIKSFCHNSKEFPDEYEMQSFLQDLVKETRFKDSLTVSFVSKDQVFQYSVTPDKIDPAHLKGISVKSIRPKHEIEKLDSLVDYTDQILLFEPINLVEGYPAFPFNFTAINSKNERLGYIAPVLSTAYLIDPILDFKNLDFQFQFSIKNRIFTRYRVYDNTKVYSKHTDPDYDKNFRDNRFHIISSDLDFCGLTLKVESRYKELQSKDTSYTFLILLWILLLSLFILISALQFKNNRKYLNQLKSAHSEILKKSAEQEKSYRKIQNLIREIHHRVKNNMQIISSLLNLQINENDDQHVKNILESSRNRIQSMALVHAKLYRNENFSDIDLYDYTQNLFDNVTRSMNASDKIIELELNCPKEINISLDTIIPVGLILNELMTNSMKYAFDSVSNPKIKIDFSQPGENYMLTYSDNGKGFDFEKSKTGFGIELILMLTEQIHGALSYSESTSAYIIHFKNI